MKSVLLAFAVFSRIPMPQVEFTEKNMRYLMAAFPLVGVAIGLSLLLWDALCVYLGFGPLLRGAGFAVLPLLLSGGIHMDGFCDTVDALASQGDIETRQRILRDPHIGSFAALAACAFMILFAALATEAEFSSSRLLCFAWIFVLSRVVTALATLSFPGSASSSLARHFQGAAARGTSVTWLIIALACLGIGMTWLDGLAGFTAFLVPLLLLWRCKQVARVQFGGMSGDLAGCLLEMCELSGLAALVVVPALLTRF